MWNKNANLASGGRIWFDIDFVVYNTDDSDVQPTATTQDLATIGTFPAESLSWTIPGIKSVDPPYSFATFTIGPSPSTSSDSQALQTLPSESGSITSASTPPPRPSQSPTSSSRHQSSTSITSRPGFRASTASSTGTESSDLKKIWTVIIPSGIGALLLIAAGAILFVWCRHRREGRMRRLEPSEAGETIPSRFYRGTGWTRSIQTLGASTARF